MNTKRVTFTPLLAAALLFVMQTSAFGQAKSGADLIKATGCVASGVEAGCLVLTSAKDKKTYNLLFGGGKKAEVGMAISFEVWKQVKMECSSPKSTK